MAMSSLDPQSVVIPLDEEQKVDGLFLAAAEPQGCLVLAHGAGAGMTHPSMATVANELQSLGVSTLRYQFPYMQRGSKRTDAPPICHATVRAAVATASQLAPSLPLFAGGRSFGGRMTSQAQALQPLTNVRGLVFFAFPLHPAGKPSIERAKHLSEVSIPMLFIQGSNDDLASLDLLTPVIDQLGARAALKLLPDADHSFHVPARTGRRDPEVRAEALRAAIEWMASIEP
jgi:predicted alpha/beta-hydrolase family hydrolase